MALGSSEPTTPRPSPTPANNLVKQSVETNSLPANFTGHNTKMLFDKLIHLRERLKKSEFETTVEYEARGEEEKQRPILNGLRIYDKFSLITPNLQADYNADLQNMRFFLPVKEDILQSGLYSIETGRGAAEPVSVSELIERNSGGEDYNVVFSNDTNGLPLSGEYRRRGFSIEISLSVEEAKRLKSTTKAILVVQFEEPYVLESSYRRQFQVRLIDVYFFDQPTGRILAKMSQVGK